MPRRPSLALLGALACALSLVVAAPAWAANGAFSIGKVDTSHYPMVRVQFTTGSDSASVPNMQVQENGHTVSSVSTYNGALGHYESNPKPEIMLTIDGSESMAGAKLDNAKAAALKLIDDAKASDRIGLVVFGTTAQLAAKPTNDFQSLRDKVNAITVTHGTALYDAVHVAVQGFDANATRRIVVLLSDGADVRSSHTLGDAITDTVSSGTEVYAVGIEGKDFSPAAMQKLTDATSGTFQSISDTTQLANTFDALGKQLLRGYWIEYHSSIAGSTDVKVVITADGFDTSTLSYTTPAERVQVGNIKVGELPVAVHKKPAIQLPGGSLGIYLAGIPFGLIVGYFGFLFLAGRSRPKLLERIEPYIRQRDARADKAKEKVRGAAFAPLFAMTENLLGKSSLFARFKFLLEQANLPLREVELLYMMIGVGLGLGLLGLLFTQTLLFAGAFLAMGFALPYTWVKMKARKRKKQFEDQLPDVLGTISASLKAGHSFNSSINAVIKETPNPTAEEFQRVMTEARLGLPLEDALDAMAARMGSDDFDFAVTTVNIQRTVGGSLSDILHMVGETVRSRQQFRKKVKALTSMGTMSAYVLLGLPIFIGGVISLMDPSYMSPLLNSAVGHKLLMAGAFFMLLGYLSCKKIVAIKV